MTSVIFSPAIQSGLISGIYELAKDQAGNFLPIARDIATGRVVGLGRLIQGAMSINPLFTPANIATNFLEMIQIHRGFQKTYKMLDTLRGDVGVLQATTNLIGVGAIAGVALAAVNLQQILK